MTMPISEPMPPDEPETPPEENLPPARRRRQRRMLSAESSERSEYLAGLAHQGTPSFDFFLFSLLSGVVLMVAILLDSEALLVLAALLAPFMAPVVGMALAIATGSLGFFVRSLLSLAIGGALVFGIGALGGLLGPANADSLHRAVILHTQFSWPDAAVLALGTLLTIYMVAHNPYSRPLVASVALAYELFLPLGAAGFGMTASLFGLWPDGLILFAIFTALAVLLGAVLFIFQGIHPLKASGSLVGILLFLLLLAGTLGLGAAAWFGIDLFNGWSLTPVAVTGQAETATPEIPTLTVQPSATASETPIPFTPTRTATNTVAPTSTTTQTLIPSPTPVYALVNAGEGNGVIIRAEPNSLEVKTTVLNGNLIQILPETANKNGVIWIHVRTVSVPIYEGWVQAALVMTATPRK
jgi:hypothetical protein